MHQAGSDSLLTAKTFFTFVQKHFGDNWDEKRYFLFFKIISQIDY